MAATQESNAGHEHLKRSLQSKFAAANDEPASQGELWQSRDAPKAVLPVIVLPPPTDIAILRRYAEEAQKQHVRDHIAQVYHSARILTYAVIGLMLSCLIVGIGMPAKWALALLERISRQRQAIMESLKERVTGERARALLAYVEAVSIYLLELAERVTGRKGLADRARHTAATTKSELVSRVTELEGEVQKKKEQLLTSIATGKQELRQREASVTGVIRQQRAEVVRTVEHGLKEVVTVVSPLRSGLQVRRRVNEFIAVANIMVQTALAVSLIMLLLPRNLLAAAVGRGAPVASAMPETLKKTE